MRKTNRKLIYFFAAIISIASFFAWKENRSYEPEVKKNSLPTESEVLNPQTPKEVRLETKIPNYVARQSVIIQKSKRIYQDKNESESEIESESESKMSLGSKLVRRSISENQSLYFKSVDISFIKDLYACPQDQCPSADALVSANGYSIFKGDAPHSLNSKSRALVTYDKEMNQYGIWQGRVIIETLSPIDLAARLISMKFETIERPQDTLFIAQYVGNTSKLDKVLNDIKNISNVSTVRLEITYSRNRGN